jgi:hypothetical protein
MYRSIVLLQTLIVAQLVNKFPSFLWNQKIYYRVHNNPSLGPILGQLNQIYSFCIPNFCQIRFNLSSHLRTRSGLFPSGSLPKIVYVFLISPMHSTCFANLILLDFIIIIYGEHNKLRCISFEILFNISLLFPALLDPNILLYTLFSNIFNPWR